MKSARHTLTAGLVAAALLAGCGFRLAGDRPLPEQLRSVYVEAVDPYKVTAPRVESAIEKRIASRGGQVKSRADEARSTLRLSDLTQTQEVLSIGADSKAIEYRLIIRLRYELDSGNKVLVPADTISVSRDFSFSAQQILAKEAEQAKLNDYLQDDMAELLLLRLEAGLGQRPPSD